jgi:hypothetical protein
VSVKFEPLTKPACIKAEAGVGAVAVTVANGEMDK